MQLVMTGKIKYKDPVSISPLWQYQVATELAEETSVGKGSDVYSFTASKFLAVSSQRSLLNQMSYPSSI